LAEKLRNDRAALRRRLAERPQPYTDWTHLKRGFSWETAGWAAALAAVAMMVYIMARALGWVIDGFVSNAQN
jgi:hypothetical protein